MLISVCRSACSKSCKSKDCCRASTFPGGSPSAYGYRSGRFVTRPTGITNLVTLPKLCGGCRWHRLRACCITSRTRHRTCDARGRRSMLSLLAKSCISPDEPFRRMANNGRQVLSVSQSNSHWLLSYSFELRGEAFGGTTRLTARTGASQYSEGQRVTVAYDPLNPGQSKVVSQLCTQAA